MSNTGPPFVAVMEPVVGVIRVYAAGAPPPAPYVLAMMLVADQGAAEIKALAAGELTPAHCVAVRDLLRRQGYHTVWWTRRDPSTGEMRRVSASTGLPRDHPTVNNG